MTEVPAKYRYSVIKICSRYAIRADILMNKIEKIKDFDQSIYVWLTKQELDNLIKFCKSEMYHGEKKHFVVLRDPTKNNRILSLEFMTDREIVTLQKTLHKNGSRFTINIEDKNPRKNRMYIECYYYSAVSSEYVNYQNLGYCFDGIGHS